MKRINSFFFTIFSLLSLFMFFKINNTNLPNIVLFSLNLINTFCFTYLMIFIFKKLKLKNIVTIFLTIFTFIFLLNESIILSSVTYNMEITTNNILLYFVGVLRILFLITCFCIFFIATEKKEFRLITFLLIIKSILYYIEIGLNYNFLINILILILIIIEEWNKKENVNIEYLQKENEE